MENILVSTYEIIEVSLTISILPRINPSDIFHEQFKHNNAFIHSCLKRLNSRMTKCSLIRAATFGPVHVLYRNNNTQPDDTDRILYGHPLVNEENHHQIDFPLTTSQLHSALPNASTRQKPHEYHCHARQ